MYEPDTHTYIGRVATEIKGNAYEDKRNFASKLNR